LQKACQKKEIQPFPGALFLHKGKRWCRIIAQTVEKRGREEMADSNSTKSALADAMKKLMETLKDEVVLWLFLLPYFQ
jgi:hypothetical protein